MNGCLKNEMNTSPLEADWNQEMFGFTPSPLSIKEELERRQIVEPINGGLEAGEFYLRGSHRLKLMTLSSSIYKCISSSKCG